MNTILIITDNDTDAKLLHDVLTQANEDTFNIEWVKHLSSGLERLRAGAVDAVLVDLSLPDSQGIATLDKLFAVSSQIPIIPLCTTNNEILRAEMKRKDIISMKSCGLSTMKRANLLIILSNGSYAATNR